MKEICLGTAMWGWSVKKRQAFSILDCYYENGGRYIDTAYNYPLNDDEASILRASKFISEWLKVNDVNDLKVFYKFGSITNRNCSKNDLSRLSVNANTENAKALFGDNLHTMMIHWDNRNDSPEIAETILTLLSVADGNKLGISGIKYPSAYIDVIRKYETIEINIQVKSNFIVQGEINYNAFNRFHPRLWAYGITSGGLKLNRSEYKTDSCISLVRGQDYHQQMLCGSRITPIKKVIDRHEYLNNLYDFAIAFSEMNPELYGYLVSPSRNDQMKSILKTRKNLEGIKIDMAQVLS